MWASGDYAAVAARIDPMAERLCEAADLVPGARVLDMGTGSGNRRDRRRAPRVRGGRHRPRAAPAGTRPRAGAR
jgi:hypothetical protein